MQDVIRHEMKEHLKDIDYDNPRWEYLKAVRSSLWWCWQTWFCARDLIDSYLIEMKTSGDPEFHEEQLTMIGMDLMSAGSDVRSLQTQTQHNFFASDHFHHPLVVCVVPCTQPRGARTLLPRGEPRISLKTHRGDFAPHKCKYKLNKIYINSQESFFGPDKR